MRINSVLPFGHTAVERAENEALLTVRLVSEGDEGAPVMLLPSVLPVDCALCPDGCTMERRLDASLREYRHISRRELRDQRGGMIGLRGQLHQSCELGSIEEKGAVFGGGAVSGFNW